MRGIFWFYQMLYASLLGRFVMSSIKDQTNLAVAATIQAFSEVALRMSGPARDKFYLRCWRQRHGIPDDDTWVRFFKKGRLENSAQTLIYEVLTEYTAMILAPLWIYTHSVARHEFNLGYESSTPVDANALLQGFLIQFVLELPVDALVFWFEKERTPVAETWHATKRSFRDPIQIACMLCICMYPVRGFVTSFAVGNLARGARSSSTDCPHWWHEQVVLDVDICHPRCLDQMKYSVFEAICGGWDLSGLP